MNTIEMDFQTTKEITLEQMHDIVEANSIGIQNPEDIIRFSFDEENNCLIRRDTYLFSMTEIQGVLEQTFRNNMGANITVNEIDWEVKVDADETVPTVLVATLSGTMTSMAPSLDALPKVDDAGEDSETTSPAAMDAIATATAGLAVAAESTDTTFEEELATELEEIAAEVDMPEANGEQLEEFEPTDEVLEEKLRGEEEAESATAETVEDFQKEVDEATTGDTSDDETDDVPLEEESNGEESSITPQVEDEVSTSSESNETVAEEPAGEVGESDSSDVPEMTAEEPVITEEVEEEEVEEVASDGLIDEPVMEADGKLSEEDGIVGGTTL